MRKVLMAALFLASQLTLPSLFGAGGEDSSRSGEITLTMGSWRADDTAQWKNILKEFTERHPDIQIKFQPSNPPDYNATLRLQLESGTGPDIMFARSYATGEQLYEDGYFENLNFLLGIDTNYTEASRAPWTTSGGISFAVPLAAVSHGIYYNKDVFRSLGISVPETWEDLLTAAKKIKDAGIVPFANGLADGWDINEVVLMSIAPNYLGGRDGRLAYAEGNRPFNDAHVVNLFKAMKSLAPYLPDGYSGIGYNDSNALFATGEAAMYFDGSWSLGTFEDAAFDWGVFAPPPPRGKPGYVTFHPDAGIAVNAASPNKEAAYTFVEWLGSQEGVDVLASQLPTGFYPITTHTVELTDAHAQEVLDMNQGRDTDVRWVWPRLMTGKPSGYNLLKDGAINVILGKQTPKQAADALADGLAKWYEPSL